MLDLSWSHIVLLLIVALVVVGPKDLPKMMRVLGRWTGKARAMANQLRQSFDEMARHSELEELRAEIQALRHQRPLVDIERSEHQPETPSALASLEEGKPVEKGAEQHEPAPVADQPHADTKQ